MTWARLAAVASACAAPFRALATPEGRRGWALMLLAGGGLSMTVFAGFALYIVRTVPSYAFQLGIGALILIGIVLTGYAGLLIKRSIKGNFFGANFEISDQAMAAAQAAAAVVTAKEAVSAVPDVNEEVKP